MNWNNYDNWRLDSGLDNSNDDGERVLNVLSIQVDGIDYDDAPDFCDAYVTYAEWEDGDVLTDAELAEIDGSIIYQAVLNKLY